jgi:hypothetical protein
MFENKNKIGYVYRLAEPFLQKELMMIRSMG